MKTPLLAAASLATIVTLLVLSATPLVSVHAANACPANPSPPSAADPSVIVDAPVAGQRVTSPVTISGDARVFEANVRITIYGASGDILADTFTTAAEAGPTLAPFSTQVAFTVTQEQAGCIRVFEESAQDGRPVNVVQVEVTLARSATTPPSTGTGGLRNGGGDHSHLALYGAGILAILGGAALAFERRLWQ